MVNEMGEWSPLKGNKFQWHFNDMSKTAWTFCVTQLKHKSPWLSHTQYTWSSLFCNRWVLNWISSRADDGLSTISRCGLNATFKVPVFSFVSTFLRLIAPENYAQLLILQEFWQFFINMPQVKREWFCAPYVGWHLCGLMLHPLLRNLFGAPGVSALED